jgi:general stress protein 26
MSDAAIDTAVNLIDSQPTAFVASVSAEGFPEVKAMLAPRVREGLRTLYLTTNTSSRRVGQFRANPRASVYFCDQARFVGVLLVGTMEVRTDPETRALIWRDGDDLYYPGGIDDPDYAVLRFTGETGRLYADFTSTDFAIPA